MTHERTDKAEVIDYVIRSAALEPEETVMVGDRFYDVDGAHKNGLDVIGVLFGFGDADELSNADHIAAVPSDILEI